MSAFLQELLRAGIYKKSQGRICRQVTFAALAIVIGLGLFTMSEALKQKGVFWQYAPASVLLVAGWWAVFRLVNLPAFADFLIAVEAEMNKVSWPSRHELIRGSSVVLITIFFLAAVLFGFDILWRKIFEWLGIL